MLCFDEIKLYASGFWMWHNVICPTQRWSFSGMYKEFQHNAPYSRLSKYYTNSLYLYIYTYYIVSLRSNIIIYREYFGNLAKT